MINRPNLFLSLVALLPPSLVPLRGIAQIAEGWEIVEIFPAGTEFNCSDPDINDRGEIVFHRRRWPTLRQTEIILYDRGRLTQITNDDIRDVIPRLNNHGHIVWSRDISEDGLLSIVRLKDGKLDVISEGGHPGVDASADINDAGHIVWSRSPTPPLDSRDVFFFDGIAIRQITDNGFSNQSTRINRTGEFVFTQYDFSVDPWLSEIFGFINGALMRLSSGQPQVQFPDINDYRQIVWQGAFTGIELWDAGKTVQLVDSNAYGARLNNRQQVCLQRWDAVHGNFGLWLINEGQLTQLTDGAFGGLGQSINSRGEIAFMHGRSSSYGIALFTRPSFRADLDLDGDADLHDVALFQMCFGQEGNGIAQLCWTSDIHNDGHINLEDFEFLTVLMEGPLEEKSEGR